MADCPGKKEKKNQQKPLQMPKKKSVTLLSRSRSYVQFNDSVSNLDAWVASSSNIK